MLDFLDQFYKNRYRFIRGYKFDKLLFNVYFILFLLFAILLVKNNWGDMDYYYCETPYISQGFLFGDEHFLNINGTMYCKNPFYTPPTWKNYEYLIPGKYGKDLSKEIGNLQLFAVFGFIVVLGLNHLLYNRKYDINLDDENNNNKSPKPKRAKSN